MKQFAIKRLGHQGDGVTDGPFYVPLTLPGEVVTGVADGARVMDVRVLTPSPDRVSPPCRHFKSCGGCQLQHASDAFVAEWKTDLVKDLLLSHRLETDIRPIHTSPAQSRRRATLAVRRTKKGALTGFHARGSDIIVEVPDCKLLHPDLIAILPDLGGLAGVGASRKGNLSVTLTQSASGLDVAVAGGKELDGALRVALAAWTDGQGVARLSWDDEVVAMQTPPVQIFGRAQVVPPPGAFLQATADGEAALLAAVREAVGDAGKFTDLFAGCGTFSLPLAEQAEVHCVEGEAAMLAALDQGWRRATGLKKVTHEVRDLFRRPLYPDEFRHVEAVILDPPRAGAEAQVEQLAKSDVHKIAYVSCNPGTFARDAAVLAKSGFQLDWVQVVDQFRWSSHTELAAAFTRSHMV
jgi:23S rRNA (uracil1939-C5)-methyltransferase